MIAGPAPLYGSMDHVDLGGVREKKRGQVTGRSIAGRPVGQLARLFPRLLDKLLDAGDRRRLRHHDHERRRRDDGNRIERGQRIDLDVLEQVRIDDHGTLVGQQDGVAVGIRLRGLLGRQVAAGRAVVLDDHLLTELVGETLGDDAGDGVSSSAGGVGHHQADGFVRVVLGKAGAPRMDVMTTRLDAKVAAVARNEFFRFSIMDLPSRCWLGIGGGELIRRTIRPSSYVLEVRAGCGFA